MINALKAVAALSFIALMGICVSAIHIGLTAAPSERLLTIIGGY